MFTNKPFERLRIQLVGGSHLLGTQCGSDKDVHEQGSIVLSLLRDSIFSRHDNQFRRQLLDSIDYSQWIQIRWFSANIENRNRKNKKENLVSTWKIF